ncbi:thyroid adenoma-associated homolog, putative [Babesia ovata]|uniref:Thyroid adenoma-associated homolog, putative n=1 Tax=Babesia ovata TaxID=189622 RepID=A0A2H6KHF8_9APIC|nr:thyroid adenoma-associated homolog, putative [Babesia ovata]GBE62424.1 thyroid adenoma-associated homolog, putative [Babesia ovata]
MGARISTRCGKSQVKDHKVSIFELLLQLSKVGTTKDGEDEICRLFQQLFDISIEDVPYETIEVYFQNFVLHNLLSVNLSHGQIYRYWECYAALLEYIVKRESVAADKSGLGRTGSASTNTTTLASGNTKTEVPISRASSYTKNGQGMGYKPECSNHSELDTFAGKEETLDPVGSAPSAENDIFNTYERLTRGKCDVVRCLTPFVISKVFIRCLVASVNAVELLFHIEYLPYYLEWSSQAVFKLNAQDGTDHFMANQSTNVAHADDSDGDHPKQDKRQHGLEGGDSNPSVETTAEGYNCIDNKRAEDNVNDTSSGLVPGPCSITFTPSQKYEENSENLRTLKLRLSTEKEPINVRVNVDESLESINNAILEEALRAWSDSATHALRRGFCFIDHKMRIFSLTCVVELLKRSKGAVEFMALPFCSVAYGGSEQASRLQRLLLALHSYITMDISPLSSSHTTFIKASQSMATDVLVILLSSIVMAPYVNTCVDKRKTTEISSMFTCIKNVPKTVRSVAPFYYIHVECVRSQLFVKGPPDQTPNAIEPVVDCFMKRNAPMIYTSVDSLRNAIGSRGVETTAWCLVRLLLTSPQNVWKRHLNALRDNVTLLMLIMISAGKGDGLLSQTEEMAKRHKTLGYSTEMLSPPGINQTDDVIEEAETNILKSMLILKNSLNDIHYSLLLGENLPQELMVAMAKAMDNISPSITCSNELWLILIDMLSCNKVFASTFYLKPGPFIREVMSTIRKHSAIKREVVKGKTSGQTPAECPHHLASRTPLIRTFVNILVHYIVHKKVLVASNHPKSDSGKLCG